MSELAVDTLLSTTKDNILPYLAILISILFSTLTLIFLRRQIAVNNRQHLISRWDAIVSMLAAEPLFMDINYTENYFEPTKRGKGTEHTAQTIFKYDALNYKAWTLVDSIIRSNLQKDPEFSIIIHWIVAHHTTWLKRNSTFFDSEKLWRIVDEIQSEPLGLIRGRPLPVLDDDQVGGLDKYRKEIDWDYTATNYHELILGPFAPEMTQKDETGNARNLLLNHLWSLPENDIKGKNIADFGCGPGNLFPHIKGCINELTGIDLSQTALDTAINIARQNGIEFTPLLEDFTKHKPKEKYDIIISVNSILPNHRSEVMDMLIAIYDCLDEDGTFIGILPSFDTTTKLMEYWQEHFTQKFNQEHAERYIRSFKMQKKMNEDDLSYADDGIHPQCFHTPESIAKEFKQAGLEIIVKPEKVYYPWSLTKKFDYGNFPGKEEIWDWFVVAKKG